MDDLISRQAALYELHLLSIEALRIHRFDYDALITICSKKLKNLPSVQSKQKTGRWIYKERNILINTGRVSYGENGAVQEKRWTKVKKPYCSECGWYENSEYEATPFCPNCGAYMKGESNDKTASN